MFAGLPFYYGNAPFIAAENHFSRGLHRYFVNESLYSRNNEVVPVVPGKEDWYYGRIGTVISDMAKIMGRAKVFDIMDSFLPHPNGPELIRNISPHIHLP